MCGALAGGGKIAAFFVKVAENHLSDDSELLELHFHNKCFEHLNPAKRNRRATGEGCRQCVSHYRTRFSKAWAFWCRSGQGDGENITEAGRVLPLRALALPADVDGVAIGIDWWGGGARSQAAQASGRWCRPCTR